MSESSLPEKPRKILRWTDSSELEDVTREHSQCSTDDTPQGPGSDSSGLSKREDWYGVKMQRLKDAVEQLRKDLRDKERDYIRLKNKYNVSKRRQVQLQEDLQKYTEEKLDLDSELEFLRLQLIEKDKELSKHVLNDSHFEKHENGGHFENGRYLVEDYGISDAEGIDLIGDSVLSRKYLSLHKETRKLLTYILLSAAFCFSLISFAVRSAFLSTVVVGIWTLGLSCLWLERKQLFRALKRRYLKKIREFSDENFQLRKEIPKLESRVTELGQELTNEKREREDLVCKLNATKEKLGEEKAKNDELVKLEKSTFEELQGERVRRRRAEEQLEEVSAQVLLAQEKNEVAECGDVCQQLRNNLKLERESKEKLRRENERLIKEIVEMNMKQERERLEEEISHTLGTSNKTSDGKEEKLAVKFEEQVDGKVDESNLKYTNDRIGKQDGQEQARQSIEEANNETNDKAKYTEEEIKNFYSKECESLENSSCLKTKASTNAGNTRTIDTSSQTANFDQNTSQGATSVKECWLCAWNIPNETSLALLIIIIGCLVLALKVVLNNNVYMFVVLMALAACFTYYQIARNIKHSN